VELRKRAPAVGHQFKWSETAIKLLEVYNSVLSRNLKLENVGEPRVEGAALGG
jgi:hypothetical protein